jgi:hypothetical protein
MRFGKFPKHGKSNSYSFLPDVLTSFSDWIGTSLESSKHSRGFFDDTDIMKLKE